MAYTRTVDDADDVETGFVCVRCAAPEVPADGPSGVYVPQTPEDWAALGLPVPHVAYPCRATHGYIAAWRRSDDRAKAAKAGLLSDLGWGDRTGEIADALVAALGEPSGE
jgi:hypothetical protein